MNKIKYVKIKDCNYYSRENGLSFYNIPCPFCNSQIRAYAWSLSGVGKKCPKCKAKVNTEFGKEYFKVCKTNNK